VGARSRGLLLLLLFLVPGAAVAAEVVTAEVTYITGSSVYVSAGREEGLTIGQRLILRRGDEVVATVEVKELSTRRASCKIIDKLLEPAVGDLVRFERSAAVDPVVASGEKPVVQRPRRRRSPIRGRIGIRYLAVADRTGQTGDYSQPAADVRVDGYALGGTAWGFSVDARARRTTSRSSSGPAEKRTRTRVYRFAVSRRAPDAPWGFTAGRQYSPALAAVSIFDGLSADYTRPRWSVGMFSGTQPDPLDFSRSNDVREHGAYVRFRGAPASPRRWSLTTGLIASYEQSEINREFLYVQGRLTTRRLTLYATQEVDYNREWKSDAGEDSVSPTSTFASLYYRIHRSVTLRGGYDNRRNIRLYRDLITPVTEFDDRFRRGGWVGAMFTIRERYRVGVDARTNHREGEDDADSFTATFSARRLAGGRFDLYSRTTSYSNFRVDGWLQSLEVAVPVGRRAYVRLGGGVRDEDDLIGTLSERRQHWYNLDGEVGLGRHWYLSASFEHTAGDLDQVDQIYATVTYRF